MDIQGSHERSLAAPSLLLSRTPSKAGRSLSDSVPQLEPSPTFHEPVHRSKDDLATTPSRRSSRFDGVARGLFLQMPSRETSGVDFGAFYGRHQPSPQVDTREAYESSTTVLPRHSRGLDFSRACTNLHHSTLADHPSPDSSPTLTHKSMMVPPSRRQSVYSMALDSPRLNGHGFASNSGILDKPFFARSVGSTNAFTSDASSSTSEDDEDLLRDDDQEDDIMTTPQVRKTDSSNALTPFGGLRGSSAAPFSRSPRAGPFASPRDDRFGRIPFRHGLQARRVPPITNRESSDSIGYGGDVDMTNVQFRRDSISQGTYGLRISSSNESGDEGSFMHGSKGGGVVKRPVVRRSNLLVSLTLPSQFQKVDYIQPKTKGFARIRAALQEESAPVDSDTKREAEVVRQVRVNDVGMERKPSLTTPSSPEIHPTSIDTEGAGMNDHEPLGVRGTFNVPQRRVSEVRGDSIFAKDTGMQIFGRMITPPPPLPSLFRRPRSSSGVSEDTSMESPRTSTPPSSIFSIGINQNHDAKPTTENLASGAFQLPNVPSAAAISRKVNKRRRDDDLDDSSIKRRAVSPGMMSVQSSPVPGQSPWSTRDSSAGPSRAEQASDGWPVVSSTTPVLGPKRVGLQGMTDTHDGIMKMSIE